MTGMRVSVLAAILTELAASMRPNREASFLMDRGWIPLGKEAGTGIEGWGKIIDGRTVTISQPEALTREGYEP